MQNQTDLNRIVTEYRLKRVFAFASWAGDMAAVIAAAWSAGRRTLAGQHRAAARARGHIVPNVPKAAAVEH